MSKSRAIFCFKVLVLLLALQIVTEAGAQGLSVEIEIDNKARTARISGVFGNDPSSGGSLQFRRSVTGNERLFARIKGLRSEAGGSTGTGTERGNVRWSYEVDLTPAEDKASAAHASWLAEDGGVLMLDDLLPLPEEMQKPRTALVTLRLPEGWVSFAADEPVGRVAYNVSDASRSVIFVGKRFREVQTRSAGISLLLDGKWNFSDSDAAKMAAEIFEAYTKMLGPLPARSYLVALSKFPQGETPGLWEAETRGSTVVIASSDVPFKDRSLIRLHEQLRHEIFHLWFPNAVNLTGDYAWFYEGAALYQSLKLGVTLKRIKFSDFLDTMSRAITIDRSLPVERDWSKKLTPQHYARAMVIAFLLDLQILQETNGLLGAEVGLKDMVRLRRHPLATAGARDEILTRYGLRNLFFSNALRSGKIVFKEDIEAAGLMAKDEGRTVRLSVASKPNAAQKAILKRLGYN